MADDLWIENKRNRISEQKFREQYLNEWKPQSFVEWIEDFCRELDCPPPNFKGMSFQNFQFRKGAWETQQAILQKLKYAVRAEKQRIGK